MTDYKTSKHFDMGSAKDTFYKRTAQMACAFLSVVKYTLASTKMTAQNFTDRHFCNKQTNLQSYKKDKKKVSN